VGSLVVSTQPFEHTDWPAGQLVVHAPLVQTWPAGQTWPHAPQL
jgi:hypothetical protein